MGIFTFLLLAALWEYVSVQHSKFCADQPESIRGQVGGSVTIPCRFSIPIEYKDDEVSVYWRAGLGNRCGMSQFIYNQTPEYIHENYTNRISLVKDPNLKRTGSIQIDRLQKSDSENKYCCRIALKLKNKTVIGWQNRHMTKLMLADRPQSYVDQLDAIPATIGGSVVIPCSYTYPGEWKPINVTFNWIAGSGDLCLEFKNVYNQTDKGIIVNDTYKDRVQLVEDPRGNRTSSLKIVKLNKSDNKRYCCRVQITSETITQVIESSHGTELIIEDSNSNPANSVNQSKEIAAQTGESVKMHCQYTHPADSDLLGITIYWMVKGASDKFVYYPSQETIDPKYRGRTQLIEDPELSANISLQINNVTKVDSDIYYCLVVFKLCKGEQNFIASDSYWGNGTRLTVKGSPSYTNIVIAVIIALLVVVIMAVILILKKKGCICKGSKPVENSLPTRTGVQLETLGATPKETVYAEVNNRSKVVEDSVLYAALDLTNPSRAQPGVKPDLPNETIYSAVKPK